MPLLGEWKRRDDKPNDKNTASGGYGTGLVVYFFRKAGVPVTDEQIPRGVPWITANQPVPGHWFTRSLNNHRFHSITHAGTASAVPVVNAYESSQ